VKAWRRALHDWDSPSAAARAAVDAATVLEVQKSDDVKKSVSEKSKEDKDVAMAESEAKDNGSGICAACYGHPCICDYLDDTDGGGGETAIAPISSSNGDVSEVPVAVGISVMPSFDCEEDDEDDVL
jgi:hypothetical protein